MSDIVKLTNQADEPINLQVNAKSWDMDENGLEVPYEQRISLTGKTCSSEFD